MSAIFLSYRRADAPDAAGRLADGLIARFGKERVFVDVDSIEAGADFEARIDEALGGCDAFLAVIGKKWVSASDRGKRRLENPEDYVRREIVKALARTDIEVVPVLVDGARMPERDQLPDELQPLVRQQAIEVTRSRWRSDSESLHKQLDKVLNRRARMVKGGKRAWSRARENVAGLSKARERSYRVEGLELERIAATLTGFLRGQKMESQVIVKPDGTLVQGRHPTGWRSITGMASTLNIGLQRSDTELTVSIAPGKWADKAAMFGVGTFVALWPIAVTSAVGFWRQRELVSRTFDLVEEMVKAVGGSEDLERRRDASEADEHAVAS